MSRNPSGARQKSHQTDFEKNYFLKLKLNILQKRKKLLEIFTQGIFPQSLNKI